MQYRDIVYVPLQDSLEKLLNLLNTQLDQAGDTDELSVFWDYIDNKFNDIHEVYILNQELVCIGHIDQDFDLTSLHEEGKKEWSRYKLLSSIAKLIEGDGSFDLDQNFDLEESDFKIICCETYKFPFDTFSYANNLEFRDSLAYLNFTKLNNTESNPLILEILATEFNKQLLALFLILTKDKTSEELDKPYFLYRSDAVSSHAISALMLQGVLQGKSVHVEKPSCFQITPVGFENKISPLNKYSQFQENLIILSEFNKSHDVISKFLAMYQIIESFMFKVPLVNLGTRNNGELFSIRDFRTLYETTNGREIQTIENLFKKSEMGAFWERDINNDMFREIVSLEVSELANKTGFDVNECNIFLNKLNITGVLTVDNLSNLNAKLYSKLIYGLRNAVVHNKETEFHLSHFNMNSSVAIFLDFVIISPLANLIFELLTDNSSKVWYHGPEIKLYENEL
jgi:hypothetical protein